MRSYQVRRMPCIFPYQWGGIWEKETNVFQLIDKVCVSPWCWRANIFAVHIWTYCCKQGNADAEERGEVSVNCSYCLCNPRWSSTFCEKAILIDCHRAIDNLKAAVFLLTSPMLPHVGYASRNSQIQVVILPPSYVLIGLGLHLI